MPYNDQHRRQKRKNIAVALSLLALIGLLYAITLVRMGG